MDQTGSITVPIVRMAEESSELCKVNMTGEKAQVVPMAIPESEGIDGETHERTIRC